MTEQTIVKLWKDLQGRFDDDIVQQAVIATLECNKPLKNPKSYAWGAAKNFETHALRYKSKFICYSDLSLEEQQVYDTGRGVVV